MALEDNGGNYGAEGFIYQATAPLPEFDGNHPVFGVWVVDHEAAGLGIRWVFAITTLLLLANLIWVWFAVPELRDGPPEVAKSDGD